MTVTIRQRASLLARQIGVLRYVEYARFVKSVLLHYPSNRAFRREMRGMKMPPLWVAYDAFNNLNLRNLYAEGREQAGIVAEMIDRHAPARRRAGDTLRVLEWGCGPGRVIQHMPSLLVRPGLAVFGTDYNPASVAWCQRNLPSIHFSNNGLAPPLPFPDASMDVIYAISVFTHLSEAMHYSWMAELRRVLKPDGILLATLHGNLVRSKLTEREQTRFDRGELVVRGNVVEGSRLYAAFHPDDFAEQRLFERMTIVARQEPFAPHMRQTLWVARKPVGERAEAAPVAIAPARRKQQAFSFDPSERQAS
jgi:SAM-dependent methyltransferase